MQLIKLLKDNMLNHSPERQADHGGENLQCGGEFQELSLVEGGTEAANQTTTISAIANSVAISAPYATGANAIPIIIQPVNLQKTLYRPGQSNARELLALPKCEEVATTAPNSVSIESLQAEVQSQYRLSVTVDLKNETFQQPLLISHKMMDVETGRVESTRRNAGGYNNRKRRFRENDEYDRRPQRRRFEEPLSVRVKKQILSIAESAVRDPVEDVQNIARTIAANIDDEYFINATIELIVQLIQEQPLKIPFIASVALFVNAEKPECCQRIIEEAGKQLNASIQNGRLRQFKLVLRFFACLQPLFLGSGIFPLLHDMFNRAADLQSVSPDETTGLELVKIILLTIPYALAVGPSFKPEAIGILSKTSIIATAPRETEKMIEPYLPVYGAESSPSQSVISLLQKQLQAEAEDDWPLSFIPKLIQSDQNHVDLSSTRHTFPNILIPRTIDCRLQPLFPELYFSLYADQEIESVPPTSKLASSLIRDSLVDTINLLDFNRTSAANLLIDVDCYWAPSTFVKRATPYDQLKDLDNAKSTWKTEDCAIDAIFSQMLLLPAPEHKLVFYHAMITETCKIAPAAIAPSLGRAIRQLYKYIDVMDAELTFRFMDWFAHHLSNFDFRWKWAEWVSDVQLPEMHPRKAFILGVLDKEVRLSFAKRIRETLPSPYQALIPATKDNDIPEFKYNDKMVAHSASAKRLVTLLRKKVPESDIQEVFDTIIADAVASRTDESSSNPVLEATDVYVTSICYIGSKSLSHVLSYIERCKERLVNLSQGTPVPDEEMVNLTPSPEAQRAQIITSVLNYWATVAPGVAVNIVDKLLNYTILTPASVIEWTLAPERIAGGRVLCEAWVYEMIERTIGKFAGRIRGIVDARHGGIKRARLPLHQIEVLDKALADDREVMRQLFATIENVLASIVDASNARMASGDIAGEDIESLKSWGMKWRRVFIRKLAVEENMIQEAAKSFQPPLEEHQTASDSAANQNNMIDDESLAKEDAIAEEAV